jgi:gliding motility-associated lipoprotein GldH
MKIKCLSLFAFILLLSCNSNSAFKKFDDNFDQNRWPRTDVKSYDFTIDTEAKYDIAIDFSYVSEVQFAEIPIYFHLTDQQNQTETKDVILKTKNADGSEAGDCSGDYCDLEQVVLSKTLKPGHYEIKLNNAFNNEYLPNVIGVGINVKSSQK